MGRSAHSRALEAQREPRQPSADLVVEPQHVLLGRVLLERRRVRVADLDQRVGAFLDELQVLRVPLFGLFASRSVVRALGRGAGVDQIAEVCPEERQLALDEIGEPQQSSW